MGSRAVRSGFGFGEQVLTGAAVGSTTLPDCGASGETGATTFRVRPRPWQQLVQVRSALGHCSSFGSILSSRLSDGYGYGMVTR